MSYKNIIKWRKTSHQAPGSVTQFKLPYSNITDSTKKLSVTSILI